MYIDESFVVALAFVVFVILAGKKIYIGIQSTCNNYLLNNVKQLSDAKELLQQANAAVNDIATKLQETQQTALSITEAAKSEAMLLIAEAKKHVEIITAQQLEIAMHKLSMQEASIMQDMRNQTVDAMFNRLHQDLKDNLSNIHAVKLKNGLLHIENYAVCLL